MATVKRERTTLRLSVQTYRRIKNYAAARRMTVTAVVDQALEEFLARHKKNK